MEGFESASEFNRKAEGEEVTKSDRTDEIRELWESTPKFVIETGLLGDNKLILAKALECMDWMADFQLKYKDEFCPLDGLSAIVDGGVNVTNLPEGAELRKTTYRDITTPYQRRIKKILDTPMIPKDVE